MLCKLIRSEEADADAGAGAGAEAPKAVAWRPRGVSAPAPAPSQASLGPGDPAAQQAAAHAEVEARVKAAYHQGYTGGETAGSQRAAIRMEPTIVSLNAVVQELTGMRKRIRMEAEESAVKLAIAIARRVIHRELATDPEAILGLVIAAFQKLNSRETHRLRVSPADLAVIQEHRTRLELPVTLELAADSSLPPGSAIFETSRGELDASVDTQLAEIDRGFADVVKRRSR
jgi:flagellar assembly protein FliH